MNSTRLAMVSLVLLFASGAIARGDAMPPWSGASVSTTLFGRITSQTGPTAGTGEMGLYTLNYSRTEPYNLLIDGTTILSGNVAAEASPRADKLIFVYTSYGADHPGHLAYHDRIPPLAATASWIGDHMTVTPPPGGALPDAVRLQFGLFINGSQSHFGSMVVNANGQSMTVGPSPNESGGPPMTSGFDSLVHLTDLNNYPYQYMGTFHIDLAVDKSGVTEPFQLAVTSLLNTGLSFNGPYSAFQRATLALTDVTLPDGTSLVGAGYGVSFASGLSPVPEPASLACWALGALGGVMLIRRRRSR